MLNTELIILLLFPSQEFTQRQKYRTPPAAAESRSEAEAVGSRLAVLGPALRPQASLARVVET